MSTEARRLRVGIDIGGTFTDAVVMDQATGELFLVKVASTPTDPSEGFIEALGRAFAKHRVNPAEVIPVRSVPFRRTPTRLSSVANCPVIRAVAGSSPVRSKVVL